MTSHRPLILVLEDEAAISILLEDELKAAGYRVAGPFATCASALQSLDSQTLKVYDGLPHGLCTTRPDVVNADLLAFIKD